MLREAIENVLTQSLTSTMCWVIDDGSDFDVMALQEEFDDERLIIAAAPQISIQERTNPDSTRWTTNVNYILAQIPKEDFVVYLCDDDLISPTWMEELHHAYTVNPKTHVVLGDTYWFWDGDDPFETGVKGFRMRMDNPTPENDINLWWQAGSFAHRMLCFYDCNVRWRHGYKGRAHSYDIQFIDDLLISHPGYLVAPTPSGYRREHDNTLSARMGRVDEEGWYFKTGETLEEEHVKGFME